MCLGWSIPLLAASVDLSLIGFFPEDAGAIHGVVPVAFFTPIILTMFAYSISLKYLSPCHERAVPQRQGVRRVARSL